MIEKVYYQRNFNIGGFLFETVGIGVILESGQDPKDALDTAKALVKEYHFEQNKEMYESRGTRVMDVSEEVEVDRLTGLMQVIDLCTNKVALERFRGQVEKEDNDNLTQLFEKKLLEFK